MSRPSIAETVSRVPSSFPNQPSQNRTQIDGDAIAVDINSAWLTAQEIAGLRLAGLPTTKRGVQLRADAEHWPWTEQKARGGTRRVYSALDLPEAARNDLIARRAEVIDAKARPVGRPKNSGYFDTHPEVAEAVESYLADYKHPARTVLKLLATDFAELPDLRTLQRFIAQLEEHKKVLFTATRDPDRFKSRYRPALGRMDATVSYAHEMWEIDTTKADLLCTDGRKGILGIIDRWSRRARFLVVDSESGQSVRRMLVTTIMAWGVMPAVLKVDNGSGFMNASIQTALDLLGIKLDPCLPGHPEDKPHVERLFGTFNRERASLLGGFIGHNVAQAQKLRAREKKRTGRAVVTAEISSTELQAILDAWCDGEYHLRTHSSLRMSPMDKWQRSPQPARAAPSESVLKIALSAYVGTAIVGKRGIRWKNGRYWSPALVAHMDRPVTLRRDEDDLGALFVFDENGNFIDTAVNAERSDMSEKQFALAARRQFDDHMREAKEDLRRKQRSFSIEKARDQLLRDEAEAAGKLVHLPAQRRTETTAAIDSITNAPAPVQPYDLAAPAPTVPPAPGAPTARRSAAEKVAEADALIAAATRGEDVDQAALRRARTYAETSEYQAEKVMAAHFGPKSPAPSRQSGTV